VPLPVAVNASVSSFETPRIVNFYDLVGVKRDVRIILDVEKVFALKLVILHATSGIQSRV
jgi:hypothetical protein